MTNLTFFRKKNVLLGAALRPAFIRRVLIINREHLILVLRLHYDIIDVGDCLLASNECVEMNRHKSAKEIWESTQPIESTCVGVLSSTD